MIPTSLPPEFLPVLSEGAHNRPEDGACLLEYVSLLAGEPFSDRPACVDPMLGEVARRVNDRASSQERSTLAPLIPRFIGTASHDVEKTVRMYLRYAGFAVEHMTHYHRLGLVPQDDLATVQFWFHHARKNADNHDVDALHAAVWSALDWVDMTATTLTRLLEITEDVVGTTHPRPLSQGDVDAIQEQLT